MSLAGVIVTLGLPGWVLDTSLAPGDDLHPHSPSQAGFLPSELALSSPGPLSPSGVKSGSQYYSSYPNHARRRAADSSLGEWGCW